MKVALLGLCIAIAMNQSAHAQSLPRWTAELSGGQGSHPTQIGSARFFDSPEALLRIGASFNLTGGDATAAYAKVDYVTDGQMGEKLSCAVTPTGGCYGTFHPGHGGSVALGVRQAVFAPLAVGLAAGIGQYGGSAGGGGVRPYVEAEIALRIMPHFALMASARYLQWSSAGAKYWYAPILAGVQVRSARACDLTVRCTRRSNEGRRGSGKLAQLLLALALAASDERP